MSKIWKSRLAMNLLCPAYISDKPDPIRMELCKALHEQVRLQARLKMKVDGWCLLDSEVQIETECLKGKTDDIYEDANGDLAAVEYVSSAVPNAYKYYDAAISACCLRDYYGVNVSAWVVPRGGAKCKVPETLIQSVRLRIKSEEFYRVLCLSDNERLEFANPASGICAYLAHGSCRWNSHS